MKPYHKRTFDYLYIFIISITTFYIWHPLTNLILQWESYTYLNRQGYRLLFTHPWESLANFDIQSMLTGVIFSKLIGLNMPIYFWIEILAILLTNISVYFLVKTLTNKSFTGFVASFIFSIYFFGIGFFLPNWYATFMQRVILNVPLMIISFLFLHRFLAEKKRKYFAYSISLFFVSIFIAHFGILLTFPIILYPIFWNIVLSFHVRSFLRGFFVSAPYIATVVLFLLIQQLWGENLAPKENILYFLTHPETYHYIDGVLRQLVYMSQYPSVLQALKLEVLYPLRFSDPVSTYRFVYPISLTYVLGFIVIWKKGEKNRALLLTISSALLLGLIVNIYLNRFDFLNAASINRYYYYPSILLAIFWALLLTTLFNKKRVFITVSLLFGFFLINVALFRQFFHDITHYSQPTLKLYHYILSNFNEFPSHSFIIVGPTADFGPYETTFMTEQLGIKKGIKFSTEDREYPKGKPLPADGNVLRLHYDKDCTCVQKEIIK